MKLRTRSASCQMSSYCCWVIGMTICLAPRGTCVEGVFRSRSTCRVFGRASILASPSLERSRMTKMPPAGYPAFLQYLQSGRVRRIHEMRNRVRVMCKPGSVGGATRSYGCTCYDWSYDQDVTQCATTDTLPRRAAGVTWRCEALGTT